MGHYDDLYDAEREAHIRARIKYCYKKRTEQLHLIDDFRREIRQCDSTCSPSDRHLDALDDLYNEVYMKLKEIEEESKEILFDILKDPS